MFLVTGGAAGALAPLRRGLLRELLGTRSTGEKKDEAQILKESGY